MQIIFSTPPNESRRGSLPSFGKREEEEKQRQEECLKYTLKLSSERSGSKNFFRLFSHSFFVFTIFFRSERVLASRFPKSHTRLLFSQEALNLPTNSWVSLGDFFESFFLLRKPSPPATANERQVERVSLQKKKNGYFFLYLKSSLIVTI